MTKTKTKTEAQMLAEASVLRAEDAAPAVIEGPIETEDCDLPVHSVMHRMPGEQAVELGAPAFVGKLNYAFHVHPKVGNMNFPATECQKVLVGLSLEPANIAYMIQTDEAEVASWADGEEPLPN